MNIIKSGKCIKVTCRCSAILEIQPPDVKFNEVGHPYLAWIRCPECGNNEDVSNKIPNSWYPYGM